MSDNDLELEPEENSGNNNEDRIKKYADMSLDDLKNIIPIWAVGSDEDYLYDHSIHSSANKHEVFKISTDELAAADIKLMPDMSSLFLDDESEDYRIMTTLEQWENGKHIDPPILIVQNNRISISDGRHRLKICILLDIPELPIAIENSSVYEAKKLLTLKPIE